VKNTTQKKLTFFLFSFVPAAEEAQSPCFVRTWQGTNKKETQAGHSLLLGGLEHLVSFLD
jgi:hypothetical protein